MGHRLLLLLTVVTVVTTPVTAVSDEPGLSPSATASIGKTDRVYQADNATNNTTVPHENPEEVEQENRLDRLASYLSEDLNEQIGESSLQLSQGEYDAARAALGDDYNESLSKYVDVRGETDSEGASDEYETARSTQREYVDTVSEFQETRQEYQEARQAGEDDRARELARELAQLAAEGESQSEQVVNFYSQIANQTGGNLSESRDRVTTIQSNISEQTEQIVAREFVETRLSIRSADRNISFRDPLVLTGALETINGTPVDADQVRFAVGERVIRTAVAANGTFEFTYRPATIDVDTTALTIEYRPPGSSVYLTSNETVPVNVTQVTATARVSGPINTTYGYADSIAVDASIGVNGTAVVNYPLVASFASTSISTARTNGSGESTFAGTVPASVPVGDATLRVGGGRDDRAVRVQSATVPVTIVSTTTELSAEASTNAAGAVIVDGQLLTSDGEAVAGQSVAVALNGRILETTTTRPSGRYRTRIDFPPNATIGNTTVVVRFDGSGTNLKSANASTGIAITDGNGGSSGGAFLDNLLPFRSSDLVWIGLAVVIVGVVTVVFARRRDARTDTDTTGTAETAVAEATDPEPSTPTETDVSASILDSANQTLSEGHPNDAVVTAYAGVREVLGDSVAVDTSATHWEFYRRCLEQGFAQEESLESLTRGYERAAYSGLTLNTDDAEAALETARRLLDGSDL